MADISADTSIFPQANPNALLGNAEGFVGLANAARQNALLGTENQLQKQALFKQQFDFLSNGLGSLAAKPDLSQADMMDFAQRAHSYGAISTPLYEGEVARIQQAGNNPEALQGLANQYLTLTQSAADQYASEYGYAPGNGATPTNVPAVDANGNPTGATQQIPLSQFAAAARVAQSPQSGPSPTAAASSGATPAVGAAPARKFVTPSPQQQKQFDASAQQQQDDLTNDAGFTANIVPLSKTLSLLPKTPLFGTGAEVPTQVAKVLNTFGIKVGSDQAQNASELEKYLTQLARGSGAAPNSDQQLAAAFSANPNMTTDRAAAQDVVKTMLSLARMQHAKVAAAQQSGVAPEQYSTFASQWGGQQDPRAYGFDLMDDKAKAALRKELDANPAEAQRFIQSYKTAQQLGIFGQ